MKHFFLIASAILCITVSNAQNFGVSGVVTETNNGFPIPGANVIIKGTSTGTTTDFDGNYLLNDVPNGATLVFSYVGFISKEVAINSGDPLNVQLDEDVAELDAVIVVGYGTQKKKEITGAVAVVSSDIIETLKPTRIEQALQGQVAGVNISSQSGSPGSASTISIRGVSTNGDSRPLILVDGNVIEDLSVINPNDIESLNILKDATAGIYGVRAANGVILITTKSGRKSMPLSIEYDAYAGFQETTRKIPVLNATEYALLVNEAYVANGENLQFTDVSSLGQGTDWQDKVFETAPIINHAITLKGGGEKSTYSVGSSFLTQDGIVGGNKSNFTRFTKRGSYSLEFLENFKVNAGLIYTHTNRQALNENGLGSVLFNALNNAPTFDVLDENGAFTISEGLGNEVINPIAQIQNTYNRTKVDKLSGNAGLSYKFLEHFTAQTNIQANWARVKNKVFRPKADYGSGKVFNIERSEVEEKEDYFRDYTFDAFLKYQNSFNDTHNVNVLLGTSIFQTTGVFTGFRGFDIPGNSIENASIENASDVININFNRGFDPRFDDRLLSYFARAQYDYKGKYLVSAVIRRDGSSKFGPKNKFGWFPSASIGWIASDEAFLEDSSVFNFLKLRASYGILGNDRIDSFKFVSLLSGEGTYVFNGNIVNGAALGPVANPEIKWEKQKTVDVGLDAKFLNNKLDLTVDYYKKRTEDLLVTPQTSGILGAAAPGSVAPTINAGIVENQGIEFSIGYADNFSDDFKFSVRYNLATLKNEVISVSDEGEFIPGGVFGVGQDPPSRMEAGLPIGYFRGYKTDGLYQTQGEIDALNANAVTVLEDEDAVYQTNAQPGDLRFVDVNNDGVITEDDKTNIGDPIPDATMGLNLTLDYKNFDFGAYAFASIGNDIVRNYERNQPLTNRTVYYLDRWTGQGTSNSFPRVTSGANSNSLFSDFYVEDGSYIRLQNVQLGYSFSDTVLEKIGMKKLRIYASATNLVTLTEYNGYDPTGSAGDDPIGSGIDYGFYPNPRTYLLGVNMKF